MCFANILHRSVVSQGFKELQYVDLLLLLKSRKIFFQSFKFVLRTVTILSRVDLYLICWLTSLRALFIRTSGNITSILLITHTVILGKQEVSRRRVARGSPGESILFEITRKHCSFKNSEK